MPEQPLRDMDFMQFAAWRKDVARTMPDAAMLCETRIARSYTAIRPQVSVPASFPTVHRCDLAKEWCEFQGLPPSRAKTAMICRGVRHALEVIFGVLSARGQRIAMPSDAYPVYGQIADSVGIAAEAVTTFPHFALGALLADAANANIRWLLLPAPLPLHGRAWSEAEFATAAAWLGEDPARRLILDGVYALGSPIHPGVAALLETDQAIYLDSMAKGWLHEQVMGVAVVPEQDFAVFADAFRPLRLAQGDLFTARALLRDFAGFPRQLAAQIAAARERLGRRLDALGLTSMKSSEGYFVAVNDSPEMLLERHHLVTLPAGVFGNPLADWSIASALPPV